MNTSLMIIIGILFMLFGAGFCGTAVYLSKALKNEPLGKVSYMIFGIMGLVTLVTGILDFCFLKELTKLAVELYGLVYLVFITVCCVAFVILMNLKAKDFSNERHNS